MPPELPLARPPERLCLVRLSALGDVTHVLPIVHTLRRVWPETELTWIIGGREAELVAGLPDVELIRLDKAAGWRGYRDLARTLRGRRFDVLLQLQVSLRAHLASLFVRAPLRLGFDPVRSRDLHRLFVNRRIPHRDREHVLDGHFGFLEQLGIRQRVLDWHVPIPEADAAFAAEQLPGDTPTLAISPGASNPLRNWRPERYAAVADAAVRDYGMRVVLIGGPSATEKELGATIEGHMTTPRPINLIGRLSLKGTLAVMARATALVSPDSGPAHMAALVNLPVIGLYAVMNLHRTGPYPSIDYCVDAYPVAAERFLGQSADELPWGKRVEHPEAMDCITTDMVTQRLAAIMARSGPASAG
ncbi:glycosyltransferase family 9 protein [Thiohalorhabdus sp.]|uniref:glycosyltransferase family 9 protein n=1 Tax=Thiohalorhabdus sp. TaxID=3094134 RepID=UPI002FC337E9